MNGGETATGIDSETQLHHLFVIPQNIRHKKENNLSSYKKVFHRKAIVRSTMFKLIFTCLFLAYGPSDALVPPGLNPATADSSHFVTVMQHTGVIMGGKVASTYTDLLAQHPLMTKMATGGVLANCGDAIAQSKLPETYDKRRAASFMLFDMVYRAVQHISFPAIVHECQGQYLEGLVSSLHLSSLLQMPTEFSAAIEQTLASQLGIVPFFYYPVFFTLTAFIQGLSSQGAIERAKENFIPLMKRNLLFWLPVQFVQFGFIDENLQIPFLSVAGLCWTFILSTAAGSASSYSKNKVSAYAPTEEATREENYPVRQKSLSTSTN